MEVCVCVCMCVRENTHTHTFVHSYKTHNWYSDIELRNTETLRETVTERDIVREKRYRQPLLFCTTAYLIREEGGREVEHSLAINDRGNKDVLGFHSFTSLL